MFLACSCFTIHGSTAHVAEVGLAFALDDSRSRRTRHHEVGQPSLGEGAVVYCRHDFTSPHRQEGLRHEGGESSAGEQAVAGQNG